MIAKEQSKKVGKSILIILLILFVIFIIDTAFFGLKSDESLQIDSYINKTFATKDLSTQIKILSKDKVLIIEHKKATYYVISECEQNILLVKDTDKDFAIKFLDENTIFCEKIKKFLYFKE